MSTDKKKIEEPKLEEEYKVMFESIPTTDIAIKWKEDGDRFEKFSMYDDYTPVKICSGTTLLNK